MRILFLVLGIPLVVIVAIIIIANCIPSFDERRRDETSQIPGTSRAKRRFRPGLVIILLLLLIGGLVGRGVLRKNTISASKVYEYEYKLSAGQKIYTQAKVEPRRVYRLWANQPFEVIGRQFENGSIKDYPYLMPAGESGWQWLGDDSDEPGGVFVLQGITNDTLVKISRR